MLLALDTSTEQLGLALFDGQRVWTEVMWHAGRHHTRELAPWIHRMLQANGLQPRDLGVVAVATGPGSFTGLRVGLSVGKALALALRIQMIGVFSLDVTAAGIPHYPHRMLLAVLPMGRGRLAAGWYRWRRDHWHAEGPPFLATPEDLLKQITEPVIVGGEMSAEARSVLSQSPFVHLASPVVSVRRPAWLAQLAWQRWKKGLVDDPVTLTPYYLSQTPDPSLA